MTDRRASDKSHQITSGCVNAIAAVWVAGQRNFMAVAATATLPRASEWRRCGPHAAPIIARLVTIPLTGDAQIHEQCRHGQRPSSRDRHQVPRRCGDHGGGWSEPVSGDGLAHQFARDARTA